MIRSKGEAGTGDIVEAVRHLRAITRRDPAPRRRSTTTSSRRPPRSSQAPLDLVRQVAARRAGCRSSLFCAGGIATPADAALVMQLGAEGVFVGSGIFKSEDPAARARAIVEATTHFAATPSASRAASEGLGHGDGQSLETRKLDERAAARRPRLVACALAPAELVGVLALQGGLRGARARCCARSAPSAREVRVARRPRRPRRARHPRRRVDDDDARDRARGPRRAAARRWPRAGTPVLGTCAGLIMLDRDHLGVMDIAPQRNAFGRQMHSLRGRPRARRARRRAACARCSSARRGSPSTAPDVEILAEVDGHPVAARQGDVLAVAFHPELGGDDRAARAVPRSRTFAAAAGTGAERRRVAERGAPSGAPALQRGHRSRAARSRRSPRLRSSRLRIQRRERIHLERDGARGDRAFFIVDERGRMINAKRHAALQPGDRRARRGRASSARSCRTAAASRASRASADELQVRFYSLIRPVREIDGPFSQALSEHCGRAGCSWSPSRAGAPAVDRGAQGAVDACSAAPPADALAEGRRARGDRHPALSDDDRAGRLSSRSPKTPGSGASCAMAPRCSRQAARPRRPLHGDDARPRRAARSTCRRSTCCASFAAASRPRSRSRSACTAR